MRITHISKCFLSGKFKNAVVLECFLSGKLIMLVGSKWEISVKLSGKLSGKLNFLHKHNKNA